MIQYEQLHVPAPCQIHYDSLPYDPDKRPCDVCQKPVYDFRDKDEKFFNKIWKQHKGDLCGAFRHEQFKTVDTTPPVFSLARLRGAILSVMFGLWTFISKAQEYEVDTIKTEFVPMDPNIGQTPYFSVIMDACKKCTYESSVCILINGVPYGNGPHPVQDYTVITLPATIKPTDIITIKETKKVAHRGWTNIVTKVYAQSFQFGDKEVVEIKVTRTKRLRIHYKRDWIGCPKFR